MKNVLLVGLGGFLGSAARYWLSGLVTQATAAARFPWGTAAVNLAGCFVIGLLSGIAEYRHAFDPASRLFLLTGMLGGFTTFSAFAYESWFLGREGAPLAGAANVALQVGAGLLLLWAGHRLAAL